MQEKPKVIKGGLFAYECGLMRFVNDFQYSEISIFSDMNLEDLVKEEILFPSIW